MSDFYNIINAPQKQFSFVEGCGHLLQYDSPEEVCSILKSMLTEYVKVRGEQFISLLYLCFGKVDWNSACPLFLYTFVSFYAWFRLLEWLFLRRLSPTWHSLFDTGQRHSVRYKMLCRNPAPLQIPLNRLIQIAKQSKADNEQIMQDAVTRILATIIRVMGHRVKGRITGQELFLYKDTDGDR